MTNQLAGYQSVAERIEQWWILWPLGRIDSKIIYQDGTRYIVQTDLYRDVNDLVPFSTDFAEEVRTNQNKFPLENAVTSSIGRSLHTAGLSKFSEGIPRPSFEEMRRVRLEAVPDMPMGEVEIQISEQRDPWSSFGEAVDTVANNLVTGTAILDVPHCQHGAMRFLENISKTTGKPYQGFVCTEKNRELQCPPRWKK
jgi:hypothetical protein